MYTFQIQDRDTTYSTQESVGWTSRKEADWTEDTESILLAQDLLRNSGDVSWLSGVAKLKKHKAPLMPLPVISTPFERVAIDIVGPMSKTKRGHQYLLTFMDYATRYPEAVPLRIVTSREVAEVLNTIFSRLGFPGEILSGNNWNLDEGDV